MFKYDDTLIRIQIALLEERVKEDIKAILGIIGYTIDEAHNVPRKIVKIKKGANNER